MQNEMLQSMYNFILNRFNIIFLDFKNVTRSPGLLFGCHSHADVAK